MKILFLSRWFPYPADNGSRLRIGALARALSRSHVVDLISFTEPASAAPDIAQAQQLCRSVVTVPYVPFNPGTVRARAAFFSPLPRSIVSTHSAAMAKAISQANASETYDLVIASQIDMAPYALACRATPLLLEELQIGMEHERTVAADSTASRLRAGLTWWKLERYLRHILPRFAAVSVVSEQELALVAATVPQVAGRLHVVANGVALPEAPTAPQPQADSLIYPGSVTFGPNWEAVRWFAEEILPLVLRQRPGTRLAVTGRSDGVALGAIPANLPVSFTGYLEDVRPALCSSRAVIVPLRTGGGTRLKILEALALGVPVISTTKGAEGLDLVAGRDLLVADSPRDFADAVACVLRDDTLHGWLSANGRRAAAQYSWTVIAPRFVALAEASAGLTEQPAPQSAAWQGGAA